MDAELNPAQRLHTLGQSLWLDSINRTRLDDSCDRVVSHAAVHFDSKCQAELAADFGQPADLVERKGDEFLPAEAGIHAHDENVVDHGEDFCDEIDARGRVEDNARLHAVVKDHLERAVQVRAGLVVDADPVGARLGKGGDVIVGVIDHQVAVEGQARGLAQAGHHGRADCHIGDEVAVHDIDVDDRAAAALGRGNLIGQMGKVRR